MNIWDEEKLASLLDDSRKAVWMTYRLGNVMERLPEWTAEAVERATHDEDLERYDRRELMRVLRVAITASTKGPSLFEAMALIGKQRCVDRIAYLNLAADAYGEGSDYTETLTTDERKALRRVK